MLKYKEMVENTIGNDPVPETGAAEPNMEISEPAENTVRLNSGHEPMHSSRDSLRRYLVRYWRHKRWTLPVTVLAVLVVILLLPFTRYAVLGLLLKEPVSFSVTDSTTGTPISGALIRVGKTTATTSASGTASIQLPVGNHTLNISKQYYQTAVSSVFSSLTKSHNTATIRLVAIGRQVPVIVVNKISGKPVANAELKVLNTEIKTDTNGKATIVLPADASTQKGEVSANAYNQASITVQVTSQSVTANTYSLTPAGSIYFLSNLSGKIDVVKTDLDGANRQTVLAGTGFESQTDTVLLASRDWKYLALYTQRKAAGSPEIDLIDTSTDTMSNIDAGNATFTIVGWDGDRFIYLVDRTGVQNWQNGQQALKSFNAPTKTITELFQTTASSRGSGPDGYSPNDYIGQRISDTYIVNSKVIYAIAWQASYSHVLELGSKQASLNSVNPDGSGNTVIKSFSTAPPIGSESGELSILIEPYKDPNSIAVSFSNTYYEYRDGQIAASSDITAQNFYNNNYYPTFLLSPSANKTFWSVYADGKNNLTVGDQNGQGAKILAAESDYSPYGWFTDNYLLVQKSGSELYILAADGSSKPFKISDYYKPQVSYSGYGGGYGGL